MPEIRRLPSRLIEGASATMLISSVGAPYGFFGCGGQHRNVAEVLYVHRVSDEATSHVCGRHADSGCFDFGIDDVPEHGFECSVAFSCDLYDAVVHNKLHIDASGVDFVTDNLPDPAPDAYGPAIARPGHDVGS